jgi:predicted aldo/keto reductase-like oxidoreductase
MDDFTHRTLGSTGLVVGRLGLAASYGAPSEAFEEAFEKGCNYFYVGSGRHRAGMNRAIRNICNKGHRDRLVVAIQTYARNGILTESVLRRTLKKLNLDYADILILGWHNKVPWPKLMERALYFKEKGLVRFLGMSGHNRKLFPQLAALDQFDLFHIRYNAAHRGAETETFPYFTDDNKPGIVSYTATRWGHLLKEKKMPPDESVPLSTDCYRFVMSHPAVDICMCGPKDIGQMQAALPALSLGPMTDEELSRMKKIGDHIHRTSKGFF